MKATFFSGGFGHYLDSGEFGDVLLEAAEGGERFLAHRLVLGYSSAYFERLLRRTSPPPLSHAVLETAGGGDDGPTATAEVTAGGAAAQDAGSGGGSKVVSARAAPGASAKARKKAKSMKNMKKKKKKKKEKREVEHEDEKKKQEEDHRDRDPKAHVCNVDHDHRRECTEGQKEKETAREKAKQKAEAVPDDHDDAPTAVHIGRAWRERGGMLERAGRSGGLSRSADGITHKGSSMVSGRRHCAVDGSAAARPQSGQCIPEPPPPPVRLARRTTTSGTVALHRTPALKDPNFYSLAITRSLSGGTDRYSGIHKGSTTASCYSAYTPRRSSSSSVSSEASEVGCRGNAASDFPQDQVVYPSREEPNGHEPSHHLPVIHLDFPDPNRIFPSVLRFMYEGNIDIMPENAIPLLAMADHYCIEAWRLSRTLSFLYTDSTDGCSLQILKKLCSDYVIANIDRENALWMLERALLYSAEEIIKTCVNVIARNFSYIYNADYNVLPYDLLVSILDHPCLAVKAMGEWSLFQIVREYIKQHTELTYEEQYRLYGSIRYRWMSTDELAQLQATNVVPSDLVIEALMARLKDAERERSPEEATASTEQNEQTNPKLCRLLPRPSFGILFDYTYNYDSKGVIFWIATNRGREPWKNPHSTGMLKVTASSIEKGNPVKLVAQKPSELWSGDVPASWFAIDLGPNRALVPNYYTLRHGGNYKADSLRTWDLQGSIDGKHWVVLKRHTNDTSLSGPFATHSWPIPSVTEAYSHFRILQTGHNSSNHNFLVLSGVEFYGELFES